MRLVVGLGNPGRRYENTRHNVGWQFVDALQSKFKSKFKEITFKKTDAFMNNSGEAVKKLATNYKLPTTNLYIVHDDLDIPLGQFKIQFAKGPKDHKGVQSVEDMLGTNQFWRIRVGIENRNPENRISGEEYTLQDFLPEEREKIDEVIEKIRKEVKQKLTVDGRA